MDYLIDYLFVNLDHIIFMSSMTHVAWSNSHVLHHMIGKIKIYKNLFNAFLKFESKSESGMRCFICKQTLGWNVKFIRYWFPTPKYEHNPNAHVAKHSNKWESIPVTIYATMGNKCWWVILQNTRVSCIHVYVCKVDYMMASTCKYKVMRIIYESYMVATIAAHY